MFRVIGADHNPQGIHQTIIVADAPKDKRIQVYVYSWRVNKHYPQANPIIIGGIMRCKVVLGNEEYQEGTYSVYAVALDGEPLWGPQDNQASGTESEEFVFKRRGI